MAVRFYFAELKKSRTAPAAHFAQRALSGRSFGYAVYFFQSRACLSRYRRKSFPRNRDWYLQGEKFSKPTFTDLYTSSTNGEPCVSVLLPYFDNGEIAGVVGLDVNPKAIYNQVNASSLKGRDTIFVLGRNGEIIFSTSENEELKPYILGRDLRNDNDPSLARAARRMLHGDKDIVAVDIDDDEYYLAFAPMKSIGWSFGTLIERSEVYLIGDKVKEDVNEYILAYVKLLQNFLFKISVGALFIVMIILAGLFYRSLKEANNFVKPIHELIEGVQEVAGGNLDKKLDIHTNDEIESLANKFNSMTDELKNYGDYRTFDG